MRKLIFSAFFFIPILTCIWFVTTSFFFGNIGFKVDKTQSGLLISKISKPITSVASKDKIISIHGLSYSEFLGFAVIKPLISQKGTITIVRNYIKKTLFIETVPFTFLTMFEKVWPQLMLIVVFLTLGSTALFKAPPSPQVTLFFLMLCSLSSSIAMTIPSALAILSPFVYSCSFIGLAISNWISFGLWLHFAFRFPATRDIVLKRKWIPLLIYLLPTITTIGLSLYLAGLTPEFFGFAQRFRNIYLPFIIIVVFIKHAVDFKNIESREEKNQIKLPLIAYWLTFSPYLFLYLLPNLLIDHPFVPFKIALFGFFILPMAYFAGIIRYKLFNIDQIISRTMAYFIIIILLSIVYSVLIAGLKKWFFGDRILSMELFLFFLILVNIVFHPVILKLDGLIKKLFFKTDSISPKTMYGFSEKISRTLLLSELINIIIYELPQSINIKSIAMMTIEKEQFTIFPNNLQFGTIEWRKSRIINQFRNSPLASLSFYQTVENNELKSELRALQRVGFPLLLPLNGSKTLLALLFIGGKKNSRLFSEQDIHLLASFANQAAIALENSIHHESLIESKQQLEKMFDEKIQAEKMATIGEMTSILAHELKNPLGIIHSSAQYLIKGKQSKSVTKEMLHYITNEVEHLNQSINSILKLARQKKPEFKKHDIKKRLAQLIQQWLYSDDHKADVKFDINIPESLPSIYADFNQLSQVLLNLVRNSEEMMGKGGKIKIKLKQDNNILQIRIIDNGPGILKDNLDKIFNNFFTTKKHGIGLGLGACEQIIQAHNGTISLKNIIYGGVEATIRLPIKPIATIAPPNLREAINEA
jgi:signal transduction histidine kinase